MKYDSQFAKKFITEYLTSSRVVTEKPCYLFSSLVSPHVFSQDCQARLRNGEMVTSDILLNLKTQWEQPTHSYSPPIYFNRGLYVELVGEILKVLDDCGDTSNIEDWVEGLDGLNPVDNQVYVKQGSHSMALGVDADKSAEDTARWQNNSILDDLSAYEHNWLYLWVYVSTLDYLPAAGNVLRFYWGSGGADYMQFRWNKSDLVVGWNLLKCDFDNPVWEGGVIDWTQIDYQVFLIYEVAGNTDDFTVYVDSLMIVRPFSGATDGITEGATVQYLIE